MSEISTRSNLEYLRSSTQSGDQQSWIVTQSVIVKGVYVLKFDSQRFVAIGCGTIDIERVTLAGKLIKSLPSQEFKTVYAFVEEDKVWKAEAFLNIIDQSSFIRDWQYVPAWTKDALGDVPGYVDRDCISVP